MSISLSFYWPSLKCDGMYLKKNTTAYANWFIGFTIKMMSSTTLNSTCCTISFIVSVSVFNPSSMHPSAYVMLFNAVLHMRCDAFTYICCTGYLIRTSCSMKWLLQRTNRNHWKFHYFCIEENENISSCESFFHRAFKSCFISFELILLDFLASERFLYFMNLSICLNSSNFQNCVFR